MRQLHQSRFLVGLLILGILVLNVVKVGRRNLRQFPWRLWKEVCPFLVAALFHCSGRCRWLHDQGRLDQIWEWVAEAAAVSALLGAIMSLGLELPNQLLSRWYPLDPSWNSSCCSLWEQFSRRRHGWQLNFMVGFLISSIAHSVPGLWLLPVHLLLVLLTWLLRGAALQGMALCWALRVQLTMFYGGLHCVKGNQLSRWSLCAEVPDLAYVLCLLIGATANTSRDARVVTFLVALAQLSHLIGWTTGVHLPYTSAIGIVVACVMAHMTKLYAQMKRNVPAWSGAMVFLKFDEIRRRRENDKSFVLGRRQEMDPALFASPAHAHRIIAVSHAWLSYGNADPEGEHLDLALARVQERICQSDWAIRRWWSRYYHLGFENDVLLFFDMSSLFQEPRTTAEERDFRRALGHMSFLYGSLDVLVITDIPENLRLYGREFSYFEKGWCWAEANQASLGGRLEQFSPGIAQTLKSEQIVRGGHGQACLTDGLWGIPRYPLELLSPGREKELMAFRDRQTVRGKVFSAGRADFEHVASQLVIFERRQSLRKAILTRHAGAVKALFVQASMSGDLNRYSSQMLANMAFDDEFVTPLHLAVQVGSAELVRLLVELGAQADRDFFGNLPWEVWGFPCLFSRAAWAARGASTQVYSSVPSEMRSNSYIEMLDAVITRSLPRHMSTVSVITI